MRLKKVFIRNFKSYRHSTSVDIGVGATIFVGRNGTGKSNFFEAIEFVLGSGVTIVNRLAKAKLFNDRRDNVGLFVEVVLEDDGGLIEGEFAVGRALSERQDSCYLNRKKIKKEQLKDLLELLGLSLPSRINITSYHMIKEFVTANPSARFLAIVHSLGFGISQTISFLDSFKFYMEDVKLKLADVDELHKRHQGTVVLDLAQRKKYTALLRKRGGIRSQIHAINIEKLKRLIESETRFLDQKVFVAYHSSKDVHQIQASIAQCKESLDKAFRNLDTSTISLINLEREKDVLVGGLEKISLSTLDLEKLVRTEEASLSAVSTEGLDRSFSSARVESCIEETVKNFTVEKSEMESLQKQLSRMQRERDDLLKRCYGAQFTTEEGKRLWVRGEVEKLMMKYTNNMNEMKGLEASKLSIESSIAKCNSEIERENREKKELETARRERSALKHNLGVLRIELDGFHRAENLLLIERDELVKDAVSKGTHLKLKVGANVFNGLKSVEKILASCRQSLEPRDKLISEGCYGTVLDNLRWDTSLNLALTAVVGNRLLSQIVETDAVGTAVLSRMKTGQLSGEVWFLPLNRMQPNAIPEVDTDRARPLITLLEFPESVHKAMSFLFGRILVCRSLEAATQVAREMNCTCVTIEGDKVVGRGPISGGYVDPNSCITTAYSTYKAANETYRCKISELQKTTNDISDKKSAIDYSVARLQQLDAKIDAFFVGLYRKNTANEINLLQKDYQRVLDNIGSKKDENSQLMTSRRNLEQSKCDESIAENARTIEALNKELFEKTRAYNIKVANVAELRTKITLMKSDLACKNQSGAAQMTDVGNMKLLKEKLSNYKIRESLLTNRLASVENKILDATLKLDTDKNTVETLKLELDAMKLKLKETTEQGEWLNITNTKTTVEEYYKKLKGETSSLKLLNKKYGLSSPEYSSLPVKELRRRLELVNEKISDMCGGVPLKSERALNRQLKFLELQNLVYQVEENYATLYVFVWELVRWIQDQVRVSLNTFAVRFSSYFREIVPDGSASLTIREQSSESEEHESVIPTTHVDLDVHFAGSRDVLHNALLSKGQQVVVLLSMILSMLKSQKVDFCIFDEIDQHLSPQQLRGLIAVMSTLKHRRFLISTHNRCVVQAGTTHYAISFNQKSEIVKITKPKAIGIVEALQTDSSRPSSSSQSSSMELSL